MYLEVNFLNVLSSFPFRKQVMSYFSGKNPYDYLVAELKGLSLRDDALIKPFASIIKHKIRNDEKDNSGH